MERTRLATESGPAQPVSRGRPAPRGERGNVLLIILVFLVAGGVLAMGLLNTLLGEIQGGLSYRHAVQALSVAEAGVHYAAARVNEAGGAAYAGETDRWVSHPLQGNVGLFDVTVRCSDGTVPGNPSPCAGAPQPNVRVVTSTGYVPSKAIPLGRRTVVTTIRQQILTSLQYAVCGEDGVTLDQGTSTYGDVGSNYTISLLGPPQTPGSLARIYAFAGQRGDATAGGTVTCSASCGPSYYQVQGTATSYGTPGRQVCPVLPSFACTPGTRDEIRGAGASLVISAANGNTALGNVSLGRNSTLTFQTTGPNETLIVQMNSLTVGQNSRVRVTGGGKVVLHLADRSTINQGTLFGVDATDAGIEPGRFLVQSCATDGGANEFALEFHQTGGIYAILFAPNGTVQLDQANLSRGAISSRYVQFDRGTDFRYDTTGLAISAGPYNTIAAWREQP